MSATLIPTWWTWFTAEAFTVRDDTGIGSGLPLHGQLAHAVDTRVRALERHLGQRDGELQAREALQQRGQGEPRLEPRPLLIFAFFQRDLGRGLTSGAVK